MGPAARQAPAAIGVRPPFRSVRAPTGFCCLSNIFTGAPRSHGHFVVDRSGHGSGGPTAHPVPVHHRTSILRPPRLSDERGFTLVEVMVSAMLLVIGILAIVGMVDQAAS